MLLNCVIIDDEPLARKGMKEYIQDVEFLHLDGEFDNPMKALELLLRQKTDLLFLDIQMPKMTGVDFVRTLSNIPMVIFTTAYPQYAVEGFELNAVDYLVKPFSFDRFCKAVMKARRVKESSMPVPARDAAPAQEAQPEQDYFFIKSDNKLVRIRLDEILFVEALQNYIAIHTAGKKYITYLTLHGIGDYCLRAGSSGPISPLLWPPIRLKASKVMRSGSAPIGSLSAAPKGNPFSDSYGCRGVEAMGLTDRRGPSAMIA